MQLRFRVGWLMVGLSGAFAACAGSEPASESTGSTGSSSNAVALDALPDELTFALSWQEATLRPRADESLGDGPSAVAALPNGEVLVLDQLGERVTLLSYQKAPRSIASVSRDTRDLATAADGSFVAFSPMRATASFFDAAGKSLGTLSVPREIRELTGIALGPSRRLTLKTGYQELYTAGSPSAPVALPSMLAGKREGAALLSNGDGVAVGAANERIDVLVVSQPTPETRSETLRSFTLPHVATAARVVGSEDDRVCLRTERVSSTPAIQVERRAVCLDAKSGEILLDRALPDAGVYVPRTELSLAGGRLVFLHPTQQGLDVTSSRLGGKAVH